MTMKKLICFALTEPDCGSDATSLQTTAKKVEGGYILNGRKRWISNGSISDYFIVWAKNEEEGGMINAFIVQKGDKGFTAKAIQNKYSLRILSNADLDLKDVFVPDNNRIENALNFFLSANRALAHSRLKVAWGAAGGAAGAYECALKYALERK